MINSHCEIPQQLITIDTPAIVFSEIEQTQIAEIFDNPLVKRYLQGMMWHAMKDAAMLTLPELVQDVHGYALKQAYMKGNLSILHTLVSITKPKPVANTTPREPT